MKGLLVHAKKAGIVMTKAELIEKMAEARGSQRLRPTRPWTRLLTVFTKALKKKDGKITLVETYRRHIGRIGRTHRDGY